MTEAVSMMQIPTGICEVFTGSASNRGVFVKGGKNPLNLNLGCKHTALHVTLLSICLSTCAQNQHILSQVPAFFFLSFITKSTLLNNYSKPNKRAM